MTKESIKAVHDACQRVRLLTMAVLDECGKRDFVYVVGTKQTGALRRASMDLTRALAEMRKAN